MMDMIKEMEQYLEFCKYRKELNNNTLKAYRIDLRQYLSFIQKDIYLRSNEGMGLFRFLDSKKQDTACAKSTYYCFLSEEGPNSITPFFEQLLEGKEISREDSLFWGIGESWAGAGGRGQELSDRYLFTMRQWEKYAKREYGGKEYRYQTPRACQVFSSDINNDGVDEVGGKNITYILYHDEREMDFQIEGYEINGREYRKVPEVEGYGEAVLSKLSFESPDEGKGDIAGGCHGICQGGFKGEAHIGRGSGICVSVPGQRRDHSQGSSGRLSGTESGKGAWGG